MGYSDGASSILRCYTTCNVSGSSSYVGGLIGCNYSSVSECYATGAITGATAGSHSYAGGLLGTTEGSAAIRNCYATGKVTASTTSYLGGFVGATSGGGSITNCYATGEISGPSYVGGFAGMSSGITLRNCVAANSAVSASASGASVNRLIGNFSSGTSSNNYAYEGMTVLMNGVSVTPTGAGAGNPQPIESLVSFNFYDNASNWNTSAWSIADEGNLAKIWRICDGQSLPFFQWQNGFVCQPLIFAHAGNNGTISPAGFVNVTPGSNQTFTFAPVNPDYVVDSLWIDGVYTPASIAAGSHTFSNVNENHIIKVTFKLDGFCGGNGTEGSPYEICDVARLVYLATFVNAGKGAQTAGQYFILTDNIDLTGISNWTPIGNNTNTTENADCFEGNFNGNGKVVKNLSISRSSSNATGDNTALFGYAYGATIRNVGVENCNVNGHSQVGGLVGYSKNTAINNCYTTGTITGGGTQVGGLVGYNGASARITNCYSTCNVTSSSSTRVGGLVGITNGGANAIVSYCYATGNVKGTDAVGGIVGGAWNVVENCVAANASLIATSTAAVINRIVGANYGTYRNNYALSGMTVQNGSGNVTITDGLNTVAGVTQTLATLHSLSFYNTAGNWYTAAWDINPPSGVWKICNSYGLPTLRWQGIACNIVWTGGINNDWTVGANWQGGNVPEETDIAVIPSRSGIMPFPVLTNPVTVGEIHFKPGAELGRQDLLTYNKAFVQLDFSNPTSRDRWWMLTNPLQQLFAGDFSFGGLPGMDIKQFKPDVSGEGTWQPFPSSLKYEHEFKAGESFEIWLSKADLDNPGIAKGLNASGGIITLPYFENPEKNIRWAHDYIPAATTSKFYTGKMNLANTDFERTGAAGEVVRDLTKAYKLTPVNSSLEFETYVDFGKGIDGESFFAATGNPFMSTISFLKLRTLNAFIGNSYWVWVGPGATTATANIPGGYAIYHSPTGRTLGNTSYGSLEYVLPPMQSVIVEGTAAGMQKVRFKIDAISETGNSFYGLRAATQQTDLLSITASTPQSTACAIIASRENGSLAFNPLDSRKLFTGINALPDVYLLKPAGNNRTVAVAANVLNEIENDIVIPLGIATTYEGQVTFSFAGMDSYNARIFFIDSANKKETELTGKTDYEYTFNYTPQKVNGTAVSNENRFFIRLSAMNPTGLGSVTSNLILVYSPLAGTIQVVSGELMQQISVFNAHGQRIYDNAAVNACEHTIAGIAPGVYVVKVVNKNEVKIAKIVVM